MWFGSFNESLVPLINNIIAHVKLLLKVNSPVEKMNGVFTTSTTQL